jgi:hypothetical protein
MKTPMTYPIRFWALVLTGLLLYQFSSGLAADWCKFEKSIDMTLDVSNSSKLAIYAGAGELEVIGVSGSNRAIIKGKACTSKESWLEDSSLETRDGASAEISVNLPDVSSGWSLSGDNYARMDLLIEVPQDLELDIKDSSGGMMLKNIAAVELQDSSGGIEIVSARGSVLINDSSGDIDIDEAAGDVTIESDSSGGIYVRNIDGTVLVMKDSSGDIDVAHVSENVIVERDSSGDISASDVGGDFRVLKDGSGGIRSNDVSGEVQVPEKS